MAPTKAEVIEWKYGYLKKDLNGNFVAWTHPTIPEPSQEQLEKDFQEWIAAHPEKVPTVDELRKSEYEKAGITIEALTVALWEKLVENRPEAADAIQAKRLEIKARFPK